ncbi:hypothetical protein [Citrobacter phage Tr1]|nr:hypothetical protein [Citrobacter phage Tr1]
MKQSVMAIHTKSGATIATPSRFALVARCKRLKRELVANRGAGFKRWGTA